ncbi:MAG: queuosine precursor transporter [Pseudomonadota bacterium]|nr:queuosine precursor transporter [Pseudomonadota bacterium]
MSKNNLSFYPALMAGFSVVLVCANFIGPAKVCEIELPVALPILGSALIFGAGNIFFPISYIFGDILTEVYGYAKARKVIWVGFVSMIFASVMAFIIINLPPATNEPHNQVLQPALELVFGSTWRIVLGSILGFWVGDFINAFVMAKVKVITNGKHLWFRTISSTIFGQAADSLIFYPIAFWGIWNTDTIVKVILFNFCFKVFVEIIMTPFTYAVVHVIKRRENIDHYDIKTDFNPFSLKN